MKCDTCLMEHCSYEPNSGDCQSAYIKNECEFCRYREKGDLLYEKMGWDHGYGFDEVRINYCPICGRKLPEEE